MDIITNPIVICFLIFIAGCWAFTLAINAIRGKDVGDE